MSSPPPGPSTHAPSARCGTRVPARLCSKVLIPRDAPPTIEGTHGDRTPDRPRIGRRGRDPHLARPSARVVRPVPHRDVGALQLLRHALPPRALYGEPPLHPARRRPAGAVLRQRQALARGALRPARDPGDVIAGLPPLHPAPVLPPLLPGAARPPPAGPPPPRD